MDKEKNEIVEEKAVSEESKTSIQKNKKIGSKKRSSRAKENNEELTDKVSNTEESPAQISIQPEAAANEETKSAAEEAEATSEELIADVTFDSLIVDEDAVIVSDKQEESSGFDEFLSDYKNVIGKTLSAAKAAFSKNEKEKSSEDESENPVISEDEESAQFTIDFSEPDEIHDSDEEEEEDEKESYDPEKPRAIDTVFDFLELFVFTLAAVLIITGFFFKHTIVVGGSMDKTLENGEHLIISDLFYTPERGDVIVFQDASTGLDYPLVKRVIGIGGDTVTVDELGRAFVNGVPVNEEDYAYFNPNIHYTKGKITVVVPEGEVFVLGDNRYNSQDSRSFPNKTVKVDCILGKVLLRIFPFDSFGTVNN